MWLFADLLLYSYPVLFWELTSDALNLRKLADKITAAGFYVAVPDFLHGDPYVPNAGRTLQDWIKDHGTVGSVLVIHYKTYLTI